VTSTTWNEKSENTNTEIAAFRCLTLDDGTDMLFRNVSSQATEIHKNSPDCKGLTRLFVADRPCLREHLVTRAVRSLSLQSLMQDNLVTPFWEA
jgi:hypothetical protein